MAKQRKPRCLSKNFFDELKYGTLNPLLNYIRNDHTLDLQIRNNYLDVYYRGGRILSVHQRAFPIFGKPTFDKEYFSKSQLNAVTVINKWLANPNWFDKCDLFFPLAKQAMDYYFSKAKSEEREFQQLIVRTNNYSSLANGTDYFFIDIEYVFEKSRFDLIAVEWQSDRTLRRLFNGYKPKLMIIEMKYGDKAIKGPSGLQKHQTDISQFISNSSLIYAFKDEMVKLFDQKRQLDLIVGLGYSNNPNVVTEFADEIDIGYLIADHDPASKQLISQLKSLTARNIKFLSANFMGYALYKENVCNQNEFQKRYLEQIG